MTDKQPTPQLAEAALNVAQLGEAMWRNQCLRLETTCLQQKALIDAMRAEIETLKSKSE